VGGVGALAAAGIAWWLVGSRPQPAPPTPAAVVATPSAPAPASVDTTAATAPVAAAPAPPPPVATPTATAVASVELRPANVELSVGGSSTVHATPRDADGHRVSRSLAWTSSNPGVASVSRAGVVKAERPGTATITATADGVRSDQTEVVVTAVTAGGPAVLQMLIEPAWAYVAIDGDPRGQRSRGVDTLRAGIHRLHFERDGFVPIDTLLTVGSGEQRLVRIVMKPKGS